MKLYNVNYTKEIEVKGNHFLIEAQVATYRFAEEWWASRVLDAQGNTMLENFVDDIHGVCETTGDVSFLEEHYDALVKKLKEEEGERIPLCWWKDSKQILSEQWCKVAV